MKPIPLIVIGSKQANAYVGSVDDWSPCINAACGLGGQLQDKDLLDCYNQTFARDVAYTIISGINAKSHYYVIEVKDTPSD